METLVNASETEQERVINAMVKSYLAEARKKKATGTLTIKFLMKDGGLQSKWVSTDYQER